MIETASVLLTPNFPGASTVSETDETVRTVRPEFTPTESVHFPTPEKIEEVRREISFEEAATALAAVEPAPARTTTALLFNRYRIERELGRGGMGVVLLAYDQVLGIPVALKLVPEELARSADDLEALRKEVLRGIALTHPGIVRVYSFERDANSAAIVMEYVDGESLADLKARQPDRCFEPDQLRTWLEQLCAVLDYAHREARIVHRDLKPRNLMITREGRLKVADFGIASSLSETLAGISVRNDSSGTPPYMSPQQAMGERPNVGDDIYSVGATLYDLLTGKPPFYRGNIIAQVLQEPPAAMQARRTELEVNGRPEIPAQWERVVAACLAKQPEARPPSGEALLQLLDTAPHALVPYAPREEIALESLRLDLVPIERLPVVDAELVPDEPQELRTLRRQHVEILPPEVPGFFAILRDEVVCWVRRLVYTATVVGVFIGVIYLCRGWNEIAQQSEPVVIMAGPMNQQPVRVEVHYVQQGPPPYQPPPGWAQPSPPPPPMPPPMMMGMPMPPPPPGGPPPRPR